MRFPVVLALSLALSACVSPPVIPSAPAPSQRPPSQVRPVPPSVPAPPPVAGFRMPEILRAPGVEGVIEQDADRLVRLFGTPRLDVHEGDMRKLQFAGSACVMDIFLYPLRPDAEPVATWIETRRASDGAEVDRQACIERLRQR
jgi:hypothetical protein